MTRATTPALLLSLAALCASAPALAQPTKEASAQAQKLFDDALALMKAGKYAEACPKLQQSQKLDPGMGTKYRLAECYESAGWVGSAWSLFNEVADDAQKAGRADRADQARKRAAALKSRVPMLTLRIPGALVSLPGLEVKRDGELVAQSDWNRRLPIDPGAHTIVVTAPGRKPWQDTVRLLEGASLDANVPPLEPDASAPAAAPPPAAPPPAGVPAAAPAPAPADVPAAAPAPAPVPTPDAGATSPWSGMRIGGIVVGVVGLGGVAVGAAAGATAKSKWDRAIAACQDGDPNKCPPDSISSGKSASTMATVSTLGLVAGGALLVTGVVLIAVAPSKKVPATGWQFVPSVGPGVAAGVVQGRF